MKEHSEKLLERKETAGHSEIHQSPARSCALAPMLRREILRGRTITFARGVTMLAQAALLLSSLTAPINHEPQVSAKSHHGRWSWSAVEITLGGMFVATLWVDRKQTRAATEAGVRESSPIIGPHPSAGQIDTYAALYSLATLGAAAVAPRGGWRVGILTFNLGGETAAIQAHRAMGFSIRF